MVLVAGTLYVGTSGFAYSEWRGSFYPDDLKDADMLPFYSGRLPSVEINYTFRRFPAPKTVETWRDRTPEGFRFALKANQRITHTRRLAGADADVSDFLDRARVMGERMGPILFQCPPSLRFDRARLESFLAYLPPTFRYAMEFRHPSWEEAQPLLAEQGVAWCWAETEETEPDVEPVLSSPFAYLRLRKEDYAEADVARWAGRIRDALSSGSDVYAYFKHEEGTAAPRYAERLVALAGVPA
jgi:uncharacterized protein YecE (DUF72 family)